MSEDFIFIVFLLFPLTCGGVLLLFIRYNRTRRTQAGWRRLIVGNLLVLCFLLTFLFVAGEAYFRFFYDTTDALAYTKASQRWLKRYYVQNAAGFRDNIQYSVTIEPGKRRVSFLGDSFAAGHGVKSVEDRFANRIRRAHPEWETHVLAKLGADTGAELALLKKCVADDYQMDQVVLVYCLNDVADLLPEWDRQLERIFSDVNRGGWVRRNSYFLDTIYHRFKASRDPYIRNYYNFVRGGYRGPVWERQKQRLNAMRDLVQNRGGKLSVVTFPFLHAMGTNYEFQFAHDELNQFWKELNVPHLDLLPIYRDLPPAAITVNRFDAHPNEFAHELAAEKIDQFLKEQIKSPPLPRSEKTE
jgi:hypothetical protein